MTGRQDTRRELFVWMGLNDTFPKTICQELARLPMLPEPQRGVAAASADIGRYSLPSREGHVQTDHPDDEEGDDPQGQQQ
jgi:hypothetical protein